MKAINISLIIVGVALLLTSALFFGDQQGLFAVTSVTDDAIIVDASPGDFIGVPAYGTLQCKPNLEGDEAVGKGDLVIGEGFRGGALNYELITCDEAVTLHSGCTVKLTMPSDSDVKYVDGTRTEEAVVAWGICDLKDDCEYTENLENLPTRVVLRNNYVTKDATGNTYSVSLGIDDVLVLSYAQRTALDRSPQGEDEIDMWFEVTPYYVYRDDGFSPNNGERVPDTFDCAMDGNYLESNLMITGVTGGGDLEDEIETSGFTDLSLLRAKGASVSYLSHLVAVVPQYDLFDNGDKYCYAKKIWQVETIRTTGGSYKIADTSTNNPIETVDCCNNLDVSVGKSCVDFEVVDVAQDTSCSAFKPCAFTNGVAGPGPSFVTQSCVSGECVNDVVSVECNFNSDCSGGDSCEVADDPKDNRCVDRSAQPGGSGNDGDDNTGLFVLLGLGVMFVLLVALKAKKGVSDGGDLLG